MANLAEIMDPERIALKLDTKSKRQLLDILSQKISSSINIDAEIILRALLDREKLGTTGIGSGLAIPHAKIDDLTTVVGYFASLEKAIDFDSLDDQPVDLVILLLAPSVEGAEHLKALAKVARIFRNKELCSELRNAKDPAKTYELLLSFQQTGSVS